MAHLHIPKTAPTTAEICKKAGITLKKRVSINSTTVQLVK